jgi:hypothetical protein
VSHNSPRTRERIANQLKTGGRLTKYDLEAKCFVSVRNVNHYLKLMHEAREIYISGYVRLHTVGAATKLWSYGKRKDAAPPRPMTAVEKTRRRRQDPEVCIKDMMQKRSARHKKKMERLANELQKRNKKDDCPCTTEGT